MKVEHQRHALSAVVVGFVLLLAGCANGTAAAAPSTSAAATTSAAASSAPAAVAPAPSTSARLDVNGDSEPGCAARAMAKGTFNPACDEYQGYLDPGTAGGREPTSGEIQRQTLCRAGAIPKSDC